MQFGGILPRKQSEEGGWFVDRVYGASEKLVSNQLWFKIGARNRQLYPKNK